MIVMSGTAGRFVMVGLLASLAYFVLLYVFIGLLSWQPFLAVSVAYFLVFICAYMVQKLWAFSNRQLHVKTLPRYALTQLMSLALGAGVAELASSLLLSHALVAVAATVASGGLSYVLSSRWVFSGR